MVREVSKEVEQGTAEWRQQRVGYITASRFDDVMTRPRSKQDVLSATAESYLYELIGEHLTGSPGDNVSSRAMDHGSEFEAKAIAAYEWECGVSVEREGFIKHPDEEWVGCSPDGGCVGSDGMIEVKCPFTTKEHVRTMLSGEVPSQYVAQVQGCLWVTGRSWCDFISWDGRCESGSELVVIRTERDEKYIKKLAEAVRKFRMIMLKQLEKIRRQNGV